MVTAYFKAQPEIFVGGPRRVIPVIQRGQVVGSCEHKNEPQVP